MATRRSENAKAYQLRKLVKDGGKLTPDKAAWLEEYESNKRKPGRPPKGESNNWESDEMPKPADLGDEDSTDDVPPPPPPPPPGDLPSPPRIVVNQERESRGGDWRAKYRNSERGGSGREQTCTLVASYWIGALQALSKSIQSAGVDPIIDVTDLAPAIVLTVDEILPDHVELSPRIVAVGGSSALLVQRFMKRTEIAAAQKKQKERATYEEWKATRHEPRPQSVPPEPEPEAKQEQATEQADQHAPSQPHSSDGITQAATRAVIAANGRKDPIDPEGVF